MNRRRETTEVGRVHGLSEYVRRARKEMVVVTGRGKPVAALVPVGGPDWEDFVVSTNQRAGGKRKAR